MPFQLVPLVSIGRLPAIKLDGNPQFSPPVRRQPWFLASLFRETSLKEDKKSRSTHVFERTGMPTLPRWKPAETELNQILSKAGQHALPKKKEKKNRYSINIPAAEHRPALWRVVLL
jgi:hypothetical protein